MDRILAGIETEYGLLVEGEGPASLLDHSMALVREFPGERLAFCWDYSLESPRRDLRGFSLDRLQVDAKDAQLDRGRSQLPGPEQRSDLVLRNGARFYNDHGHPEYSTQESFSSREAALCDKAGEAIVWSAAQHYERLIQKKVRVFKNNTDFHQSSYGTHESFLVPRSLGFEKLFHAVLPMLVCRQILTGAGKVGSESGPWVDYQISQRADFFAEPVNAETLSRRPIFNTRDEPHGDPRMWMRLHVISGDACMMAGATTRKLELVKLAIRLALADKAPQWKILDPVGTFQRISRSPFREGRIDLEGGSWTTPREVLESYLSQADAELDLSSEEQDSARECQELLEARFANPAKFARSVDWAAKHSLILACMEDRESTWSDPLAQSLDLAYSDLDPEEGLFGALSEMGAIEIQPHQADVRLREVEVCEPTRALARSAAVQKFKGQIKRINWSSITFATPQGEKEIYLPPNAIYPEAIHDVEHLEDFIRHIEELNDDQG